MSKDFNINLSSYPGYEFGEVSFIIKLLCQCKTNADVKRLFNKFTNGEKSISEKLVEQIRIDHAKRIIPNASFHRKNIKGSPLGNPRLLADLFLELAEECREAHGTGRVNPTTGEELESPDYTNAIRALDCGAKHVLAWEKLEELRRQKAKKVLPSNLDSSGEPEDVTEEDVVDAWDIN